MPPIESLRDVGAYYATLGHETVTGQNIPLALVATSGVSGGGRRLRHGRTCRRACSAFLCADLELTPGVREDHASYVASWIEALKNDKRAIFGAASHAQRAADFLHGLQPNATAQSNAV
jgi:antirestriction protein ArdC